MKSEAESKGMSAGTFDMVMEGLVTAVDIAMEPSQDSGSVLLPLAMQFAKNAVLESDRFATAKSEYPQLAGFVEQAIRKS